MKKEIIVCLALSTVLNTVSFADLSSVENDDNSKIYQQKYTYTSSSRQATYLSLPAYPINLNGKMIDNAHLEYPFLTYKGITYMPLTYNLTRCLGIETSWTSENGLKVDVTNVSSEYNPQLKKSQNAKRIKVQAPQYQVLVNDTPLSGDDTYPCFVYNNIVYLPLTTELTENELNLSLQYDGKRGLAINAVNSIVKKHENVSQNLNRSDWKNMVRVCKNKIYYIDDQNRVMVDSSVESKAFVEINEIISHYMEADFISIYGLTVKGNDVLLTFHIGGALMGEDLVYKLFEDGTSELISSRYYNVSQFDEFNVRYWAGPFLDRGNLGIALKSDIGFAKRVGFVPKDEECYKQLGSTDILYGIYWHEDKARENESVNRGYYSGAHSIILRGDDLYLLGYDRVNGDHTSIYKVNYKTNETKELISHDVGSFIASGDELYYISPATEFADAFYRYNINTQKDEMLYQADGYLSEYAFLGTHLYFIDDKRQFKMVLDENTSQPVPSTESTSCEGLKLFDDEETYLVSTFKETADSKYRIIVLNEAEEIVFKTSDYANLRSISIDDDVLYYVNEASGNLCSVSLKGIQ